MRLGPTTLAPARLGAIIEDVRSDIVSGRLRPGQRLPTRLDLVEHYQASSRTLQLALGRLIADGFLRADRRDGTFVVDNPPHLCRYGLVFPHSQSRSGTSRHWAAIMKAVGTLDLGPGRTVACYYGMEHPAEAEAYTELVDDIHAQKVAGLIFSSSPHALLKTPVLEWPGLPRIAIMSRPDIPGIAALCYRHDTFVEKTIAYLKARGRRRLGIFEMFGLTPGAPPERELLIDGAREAGFEVDPAWVLGTSPSAPELTRNCVRLLMNASREHRPDGLVITDDNIVEDVTAGLLAAGVRVPDECDVVAHANFPDPPPARVPVWRLGYDMAEVLHTAMGYIDLVRRGGATPDRYTIVARSQAEVRRLPSLQSAIPG